MLSRVPDQFSWQGIESLQETPVSGLIIMHQSDLLAEDYPYIAARKVLILLDKWDFSLALKWIMQGVNDSAAYDDLTRIATWIVSEKARISWHNNNLAQQENILQTVLDAIPVPIFYKDEFHIYRGCNQAFSEFIGLPKESVVNHSVYDIAPKELADIYYQADQALLDSGGTQVYEAAVKNAQGEQFEIEFNKAVFFKENGDKAGQVGAMLDITERNRLMRQLDQASRTDPLTGVGNRREFNLAVSITLQKAQNAYGSTSLLTIDIDHFKSINDRFGHSCGDEALKFLVSCIHEAIPATGQVFRIGGEEFYVLLPKLDLAQAKQVAERVRQHIPEQVMTLKSEPVQMTVSIGVIQLASENMLEESFKRVDQALYEAKMTGRNRVCLAYYD
ncbi:GGDEF domain-containing protein [Marinomonas aquimarina]|uniref:GGDEF domain-containing protein n=1 Tax=Marinomonas aquimarina TaxID=295068 RepID=UPI0018D35331|nr:GGDEF domain-containing protein [Marinomonas aquimarina]